MQEYNALLQKFSSMSGYADLVKDFPTIISSSLQNFGTDEELEIATNVILTCVSAILTDVSGTYNKDEVFPMLYTAVVANAASNKGIIDYGNDLLEKVDAHFREQSKVDRSAFKAKMSALKAAGGGGNVPEKPPYKVAVLSASITGAKLVDQLNDNQGDAPSIIIADEIDTISEVDRGDFGGLSHMLRSAYHHAKISQQLKGDNQDYVVKTPKLAMLIGGTPEQMLRLIGTAENGLYSRFCVIPIQGGGVWNDVSPGSGGNIRVQFRAIAPTLLEMFLWFRQHPLKVTLSEQQWKVLNEFGHDNLGRYYNLQSDQLSGVVKRHGLMMFKFAMILTAVRTFSARKVCTEEECNDIDFETAFFLAQRSLHGSVKFFKKLKGGQVSAAATRKVKLLHALKDEFSRSELIVAAKALRIPDRTADRYLADFVYGNIVAKTSHGTYGKVPMANLANWQDAEE